jgi:hypothetical protein
MEGVACGQQLCVEQMIGAVKRSGFRAFPKPAGDRA